jgi:hypothetical protein
MQQHNHTLAVRTLDLLLEFFADHARWMRGHYHDDGNRRCLMGALDHLQCNHRIPYAGAVYFLQQALPSRQCGLVNFNDRLCASVAELRSVIMKARALALEDAEGALAAAAMERKLLAEVERYRAAKMSIRPVIFSRRKSEEPSEIEQPAMKQAA